MLLRIKAGVRAFTECISEVERWYNYSRPLPSTELSTAAKPLSALDEH